MKVTKRYNQSRRDLSIDMQCEACGEADTYHGAYDDRNFWDNVVPGFTCKKCGKSSKDLGIPAQSIETSYPEVYQI